MPPSSMPVRHCLRRTSSRFWPRWLFRWGHGLKLPWNPRQTPLFVVHFPPAKGKQKYQFRNFWWQGTWACNGFCLGCFVLGDWPPLPQETSVRCSFIFSNFLGPTRNVLWGHGYKSRFKLLTVLVKTSHGLILVVANDRSSTLSCIISHCRKLVFF